MLKLKSYPASKPQPRAKPVVVLATNYKSYIPTHLRDYILLKPQEGNPLEATREALFEDAILNNYYRLIQNLINSNILGETTYYFTCRDTPETRIHRPLGGKYDNRYIYPWVTNRTNRIRDYQACKTAHIALQMAAQYGNLRSYIIIESAVELYEDYKSHMLNDTYIQQTAIFAIGRDEIELFNHIREYTKCNTEALIYHAQSLTAIRQFVKKATYREKQRLLKYDKSEGLGITLCSRRRWDLFETLIPKAKWINYIAHGVMYGFIELLDQFTNLDNLADGPASIPDRMINDVYRSVRSIDALIRASTWLKRMAPDFMKLIPNRLLVCYFRPNFVDWYLSNGYEITPDLMETFLINIVHLSKTYGYPSVEVTAWEACLCKLRDLGVKPSQRIVFTKVGDEWDERLAEMLQKYPEYYTFVGLIFEEDVGSDLDADLEDAQLD